MTIIDWIEMTEACSNGGYIVANGEAKFADNIGSMYFKCSQPRLTRGLRLCTFRCLTNSVPISLTKLVV